MVAGHFSIQYYWPNTPFTGCTWLCTHTHTHIHKHTHSLAYTHTHSHSHTHNLQARKSLHICCIRVGLVVHSLLVVVRWGEVRWGPPSVTSSSRLLPPEPARRGCHCCWSSHWFLASCWLTLACWHASPQRRSVPINYSLWTPHGLMPRTGAPLSLSLYLSLACACVRQLPAGHLWLVPVCRVSDTSAFVFLTISLGHTHNQKLISPGPKGDKQELASEGVFP